ncbi:hypothetical protein FGO68_gene17590 [Halteria grandinella]|uniref:cystathionine gamma-lyase n=1 Tax=Halteria grandinella TaxID=5974 RepID=A0A8J8NLI2_HALGN|nr:hypothetical protein FGO68_gene17590 [Halteria grandinella]
MESETWQEKAQSFISKLEHAKYGLLFNSGVSAICGILASLPAQSTILVGEDFYSGTRYMMNKHFGERFTYLPIAAGEGHVEKIREVLNSSQNISMVFLESPTNPLLHVYDIKRIAEVCKEHKVLFAVDNTFCTPIFQNPLLLGTNVVVHSATKFLSGHSDVCGGYLGTNDEDLYTKFHSSRERAGNHLEDMPSHLLYEGLQTLKLRVHKQHQTSLQIATYLSSHPKISKVLSVSHSPLHASQSTGFTGMLSFYLNTDDFDKLSVLARDCRLFKFGTSLGGVDSLLDHYGGTMRIFYSKQEQVERGYTDNFFRMSVGCEEAKDLIGDLEQALEKI